MSARAVFPRKNKVFFPCVNPKPFIKRTYNKLSLNRIWKRFSRERERARENDNVDDDLFSSSDGKGRCF